MNEIETKYQMEYVHRLASGFSVEQNRKAFENIVAHDKDIYGWPIVGITLAAVTHMANNNFLSFKGLNRAHITDRKKRGDMMFKVDEHHALPNALAFFLENDRTVIATPTENVKGHDLSSCYPLDPEIFRTMGTRYGIKTNKQTLAAVRKIWAQELNEPTDLIRNKI